MGVKKPPLSHPPPPPKKKEKTAKTKCLYSMQSVFLIFYGWEMMRELQEPLNWAKIDTTLIFALLYTKLLSSALFKYN